MNLWVLYNTGNFLTSWNLVSFLGRTLLHRVFSSDYTALNDRMINEWLFGSYVEGRCSGLFQGTVELYLSRLIGTASHRDMQKIRIIGFFFENRLHWESEVRLLLFALSICFWIFRPRLIWSSRCHNTVLYVIRWPVSSKQVSCVEVWTNLPERSIWSG
jgi:hypothetical protein